MICENDISIVVLAEYKADFNELILLLSKKGKSFEHYFTAGCDRINILGSIANIEPNAQSPYYSIQLINKEIILCCVHLPSKIYSGYEGTRNITISRMITDIEKIENDLHLDNTVIVGDLNINPYEAGCIEAPSFHGIPVYEESIRKSRVIADEEFRMFYNPMWNFLGDFEKPYGTYYYGGSTIDNTYWHIYDQVLIRPSLRKRFVAQSLKIILKVSTTDLLNEKGHPNDNISDHLPILFEIKES